MKTTRNLKTIITCILVACIVLTGIGLDNTVTVNAASRDMEFEPSGKFTMKLGETKWISLIMHTSSGVEDNYTNDFNWTSSDESVVSLEVVNLSGTALDHVEVTVNGTGTAKITCTAKNNPDSTASMTVTVKAAKKTAKQKKCHHKYKVTRKATCERPGMKTCKKCKWQVVVPKTDHKWKDTVDTVTEYRKVSYEIYCTDTYCENYGCVEAECEKIYGVHCCPHICKWTSGKCDTFDEAMEKFRQHKAETKDEFHRTGHATWGDWDYPEDPYTVTKHVKECVYCGAYKE